MLSNNVGKILKSSLSGIKPSCFFKRSKLHMKMQQLITSRVSSQLSPSTLPRFHPSLLRTGSNYCSGPSSAPSLYLTFSSEEIRKAVSSRQVPPALEPWIVTPGGGGQTTLSQGSLSDIYFTFITQQNHSCEEAVKIIYVWRSPHVIKGPR